MLLFLTHGEIPALSGERTPFTPVVAVVEYSCDKSRTFHVIK